MKNNIEAEENELSYDEWERENEAIESRLIDKALNCKCGSYRFTSTNEVIQRGDCVCN